MRSILLTTGLLLLAGWLGLACQSGDPNVGQDIITPNQLDIQYIDTLTVFTSTVAVPDTFATSGDTTFLAGHWRDALAGATDAASFCSPSFTPNTLADQTDIVYDSLVLELPYSYIYGDTTQLVTLQAFKLNSILPAGRLYYNNSSAATETTPFAERTFYPRPRSGREAGLIRIRLSDDLGQQLYGQLRNRAIETNDQFRAFLPGLSFTTTSNANLFMGFSANYSNIALYYHQITTNTTKQALRFGFSGTHFNRVLNNFSGTPLATLRNRADRVPSTATNHTTFLSTGPALRTRIDMPALAQLTLTTNYAGINGAQLVVQPVFRTQRDYLKIQVPVGRTLNQSLVQPAGVTLYETNANNDIIGSSYVATAGYLGYNPANPYSIDLQDSYNFDLSTYMLQVLRGDRPYRPLLLVMSGSNATTTLERMAIGDRFSSTDPIRLRLLLTYKKQ